MRSHSAHLDILAEAGGLSGTAEDAVGERKVLSN